MPTMVRTVLMRALWHAPSVTLLVSVIVIAGTTVNVARAVVAYERQLAEQARV